jgi:signal transduction histidine kinase
VIHEILAQISRLDDAVKDLLVYARPKPPELLPCRLAAVVDRVVKMNQGVPSLRYLQVCVTAPEDLPLVSADAGQLEQLVINLLFNAAHASPKGAQIDVSLESMNGTVRLVLADQGHGMDIATCDRAFEPFFTTKAKGTGLGLPICKKIAEAHGGSLRIRSGVNRGTQAILDLPIHKE